jgi:carbamoyltransferase
VVHAIGDVLLHLARELHRRVPGENLCFGGALAGQRGAERAARRRGPVPESLRASRAGRCRLRARGAWVVANSLSKPKRTPLAHAFLGETVARGDDRPETGSREVVERFAEALAKGRTVGWARGRFEWGARSLGNRSILASPLGEGVRARIGESIKRREAFLPLCCAVPAERAAEFFDLPAGATGLAPFLHVAARARNGSAATIPSVLQGGSVARPHFVDRNVDPAFHELLVQFGQRTGVPVLVSTSLNLRGDPIARGEADAAAVFDRSGLDLLAVEGQIRERGA